jgi:hypothetical protein
MSKDHLIPSIEEIDAAKLNPNGWVYRFSKKYSSKDYVPPEDIIGAWHVDSNGNIIGDFIKNSKFIPKNDEV